MTGKELGTKAVERSEHGLEQRGMTLRQHFAGLALQGNLACGVNFKTWENDKMKAQGGEAAAVDAVAYADALLNELAKEM